MATTTFKANLRIHRTLVLTLTIYFARRICLKDDFWRFLGNNSWRIILKRYLGYVLSRMQNMLK